MSDVARKFVVGILLFLLAGGLIGGLYGNVVAGVMVAALLALFWQLRQLLGFERALRTGDFDEFRYGEGLWEQLFSRFRYEHDKAARRKLEYRHLLKEIRKSTNAMPDGAVVLNPDNEIVTCNRAAKVLAGFKRKKDRGQRVDNILRDPGLVKLLHSEERSARIEIPSPLVDGNWLSCRVVPYGADQKLLMLSDVTERYQLSKMRRDFVANASHELRSPLTVISGYLDALADTEPMPATWVKPVAQMRVQAQRMRHILGELLELSRLEGAGKSGADQEIDVVDLLHKAKQAFEGHARVASIEVHAESSARLAGDPAEIETVVVNLLSNAVRFTPVDGKIALSWRTDAEGGDLVARDTGEGIDPKDVPRLTERFFRVDKGRSREAGGTGLGLAIVKHVLVRHDADLIIASAVGEGSEFRCHFPAERIVVDSPSVL